MQEARCYIAGAEILIALIALSCKLRSHISMPQEACLFLPWFLQGEEILAAWRSSRFQESRDVTLAGIGMAISVKLAF